MAGSYQSAASKRDFPSFRIEERPGTPDIARASSPRQLIPLTSLVPKTLLLKSEKPKLKPATRSETNPSSKSGHHQLTLPHLVSGPANSDIAKSWHVGKFHVLKPTQERNGISSHDKYNAASSVRVGQNLSAVAPLSTIPPLRSSNNPKRTATEHNASSLHSIYAPTMEKRPMLSQTQSRSDFFKLMRKKSSTNLSSAPVDPNHVLLNASRVALVTLSWRFQLLSLHRLLPPIHQIPPVMTGLLGLELP